ncbi:glycosyltransferase family 9 protein [Geobacter sp.]|uniref:glycosyltransferase family 9 protein n=1 Tax=Geobacter sp. TaxID=46610 RepID=UPI00260FDD3D|nr:glycosyltransferase family 9 protein [Geobacter sp.]
MTDNVSIFRRFKRLLIFLVVTLIDFAARSGKLETREKTLLLVRVDLIGDYVVFRNFIEVIKNSRKYCDYAITLCGNVAWRELAETFDGEFVDNFIWIDRERLEKKLGYRFRVLREIARLGAGVAIQPTFSREFYHGDAIVRASRARERVGSVGDLSNSFRWQKLLADRYYTKLLPASPENLFEFHRSKEFFEQLLGEPIPLARPSIQITAERKRAFGAERLAVVFPGASGEAKRWHAGNFTEIAHHLSARHGFRVVIAGAAHDGDLARRIMAEAPDDAIDMTGKTTLSELAALLASARLLVSNDTSAVHLALAVDTRTVCVLTGSHFGRYAPYPPTVSDRLVCVYPQEIADIQANFAYLGEKYRNISSPLDINSISVETVKKVIDEVVKTIGN